MGRDSWGIPTLHTTCILSLSIRCFDFVNQTFDIHLGCSNLPCNRCLTSSIVLYNAFTLTSYRSLYNELFQPCSQMNPRCLHSWSRLASFPRLARQIFSVVSSDLVLTSPFSLYVHLEIKLTWNPSTNIQIIFNLEASDKLSLNLSKATLSAFIRTCRNKTRSQKFCVRQKDDLHSVKLVFEPAQKVLKRQ